MILCLPTFFISKAFFNVNSMIQLEEEEPIDIFLDLDLPWEKRADAANKLKEAGFTIYAKIEKPQEEPKRNDCGVNKTENPATDEENEPPFELTGE